MAIRTDLSVNWELSPRIITVAAPSTTITIQDLHDTCRDIEDNLPEAQEFDHLVDSAGKEPLGGGAYVGITLTLQNAKLAFEARPPSTFVPCTVSGGNLVAVDENGDNMDPIQVTAYTQVTIAQSSSPTIIQAESDYGMLYLLESMRGSHKSVGTIYYWNPNGGDDADPGTTPATAVATFAQAHTLVTDGAGDIIFALSTPSGGTSVTELLTITKNNLKVRGPGYLFTLTGTLGSPTVNITSDNVELSGFYITTQVSGTDNGITVTGDKTLIEDCWIESATGNGIDVSSSTRTEIDTCAIENCTSNGINIGASTSSSTIKKCIITGNADGIDLAGASVTDNIFENNIIYNNTGIGIDIGTGVTRTGIRLHHTFADNGTNINDLGTDTFQDTSGTITQGDIDDIVDGVWDEVISGHTTAGTTGKTLKDAKTRATLASLK